MLLWFGNFSVYLTQLILKKTLVMDNEIIHKELDLIQKVIERMASNSFEVKKWLIGILTGIVVFKRDEMLGGNYQYIWLLLVPVLCFWYLDAFFLSTEKLYRELYKWVIIHRSRTNKYLYDLNTFKRFYDNEPEENLLKPKNNVWIVMFSRTLLPFYLVPIVFILALLLINCLKTSH